MLTPLLVVVNTCFPASFSNVPFEGSFDGSGFAISNLTVNRPGTGRVGLFGTTDSAVIENIGLVDVAIEGAGSVGGSVGYESSGTAITNSYASGSVTGNNNWVGGLVGYANSTSIAGSYAAAAVSSSGNSVGGLVGYAQGVDVTGSHATGTAAGAENVGGLVGYARQTSTIANSYAQGDVSGDLRVGGLVGYERESSSITASYATGAVEGDSDVGIAAGGLVGAMGQSSITASYATGTIGGDSNVGGLVGNAFNSSSITASYAAGAVTGTTNVGGVLGNGITNSSITASYWDTEASMQSQGVGSDDGTLTGTPTVLTSTAMLAQSSFVGFNFVTDPPGDPVSDTPWVMIDGSTRPYLYWQDDDGDGDAAYLDDFPLNAAASVDTDGDGLPDDWNTGCDATCLSASGLTLDGDDDNDGVADGEDTNSLDPNVCRDLDGDSADDCSVGTDGFGPLNDFDPSNDGLDTDGDGAVSCDDFCAALRHPKRWPK